MLSILGFVAVIFAAYYVYKTAKDTKHNAIGWALLTFVIGFSIQFILPVVIGMIIAVVMSASGNSMAEVQDFVQKIAILIAVACLVLSFFGIWLVMRHVIKVPEDNSFVSPPPPPTFGGK